MLNFKRVDFLKLSIFLLGLNAFIAKKLQQFVSLQNKALKQDFNDCSLQVFAEK